MKRYRRFLADVQLESGGIVTAHCPNSGTLRGCSDPGATVFLSDSQDPARKHPLTWELTETGGTRVCINTALCRKILLEALRERLIPSLAAYDELATDATVGRGATVDVMLTGLERNTFVALHHVTWAENGVALYPDAVHQRSTAGLRRLADIAHQGHHAVALFLIQRGACTSFRPAEQIDREFLKAMLAAVSAGVELLAHRISLDAEEWRIGATVPCTLT